MKFFLDTVTALGVVAAAVIYLFTLWQMQDSSARGQRAYVCIVAEHEALDPTHPPTFKYRVKNCGITPASGVWVESAWKSFPGENTDWPSDQPFNFKQSKEGSLITVFPDMTAPYTLFLDDIKDEKTKTFSDRFDEFQRHSNNTIYIYVRVKYNDVFGKS
jgi:hypothetical protein